MRVQAIIIMVVFLLKHQQTFANLWQQSVSETLYLQGYTLKSFKTNTIFECYAKCDENLRCASINMDITDNICELKYTTKTRQPSSVLKNRQNIIYMELREGQDPPGSSSNSPVKTCKELSKGSKSGVYWIKPAQETFQVYCEMETEGGGWTLVYSYQFTNYALSTQTENAVTPAPSWPVTNSGGAPYSPISRQVPLSNTSYSAMDFSLWKNIGTEMLFTSNINDWYWCTEGDGSLVNWKSGSITCKRVKEIIPPSSYSCSPQVPVKIDILGECAPDIEAPDGTKMYKWEARSDRCVPFNDPCGNNERKTVRYLTNVANAGGQMYIR